MNPSPNESSMAEMQKLLEEAQSYMDAYAGRMRSLPQHERNRAIIKTIKDYIVTLESQTKTLADENAKMREELEEAKKAKKELEDKFDENVSYYANEAAQAGYEAGRDHR